MVEHDRPEVPRQRICLGGCEKPFLSLTRGHRLCDRCNARNAGVSRLGQMSQASPFQLPELEEKGMTF